MLKLQTYFILAVAAMSCTAQDLTATLNCGSPPQPIDDNACQTALTQLAPYVKNNNLVRDESAFQVSCAGCKLTIGTSNGGNLNVLYEKVQLGLNNLLAACPQKGASLGMSAGSTNTNPNTDTGATLTISYPTTNPDGCSII
ncbi:uncharacterized protein MELLADRAFT_123441 [Melampsora larici-populina 98AG31]|uniref:Secreted protein n=1 Tax=Melampsora larici-populina (strain 98AG31 / pathotype 3-4-7) TaxID=747676 RepID=F4RJ23_MELLP|nr:uncharacterized protein MELLADRAFT_123441 [Melampsora larici-populina 98AG31]EGG07727.1 secreted protein [Melampsora larici-populina 98AG31]